MMVAAIRIQDDGRAGDKVERLIEAGFGQDLHEEIGAYLEGSVRRRFRTGRGPDGAAWPASLRVRQAGGQTLVDRGHLLRSITYTADERSVTVGSNLVYAGVHQYGARISAKTARGLSFVLPGVGRVVVRSVSIPARPFLGVSDDDRAEITDIIADHIDEALA